MTDRMLSVPVLVFALIVLTQARYVPIWDSAIYAECVVQASKHPWNFDACACEEHLSHVYIALLALPSWLFGSPRVWHWLLINSILGSTALWAVYGIARSMFPERRHTADCLLLTCTAAVHPNLLASAVFFNVDYGVYVFGLVAAACLLKRRYASAAWASIGLVFSKETGIAVYCIEVATYLCVFELGALRCSRDRLRQLLHLLPLAAPGVLLIGFALTHPVESMMWGSSTVANLIEYKLTFQFANAHANAMWVALFVLQFGWLTSGVVVFAAVRSIWHWRSSGWTVESACPAHRAMVYVLIVTSLLVVTLTRFQTYVNTRYLAILYPMLLLVFHIATMRLLSAELVRRGLLLTCSVLFGWSAFRTIDPVSKRLYGTFDFGEHAMLAMASIPGECCGFGLDQLAYNLEFTRIAQLLGVAVRHFQPTRHAPLVVATGAAAELFGHMDPTHFERAIEHEGTAPVPGFDLHGLGWLATKPKLAYFIALPNMQNLATLAVLENTYNVLRSTRFESDGYSMRVYHLSLRSP